MSYLSTVIADAPINWWRLADPGGSLAFDVGSVPEPANYQILGCVPYYGPASDGGSAFHSDSARCFNRANGIALTNTWSVEAWYWLFDHVVGDQAVFSVYDGVTRITVRDQAAGGHLIGFVAGQPTATSAVSPSNRTWHQVVLTYDHATLRLYLDGAQVATSAFVASTTSSYHMLMGEEPGPSNLLYGWLSELAVYSTTLSLARVAAHYAAADTASLAPSWRGGGTLDPTTGGGTGLTQQLLEVLGQFFRTFPPS